VIGLSSAIRFACPQPNSESSGSSTAMIHSERRSTPCNLGLAARTRRRDGVCLLVAVTR